MLLKGGKLMSGNSLLVYITVYRGSRYNRHIFICMQYIYISAVLIILIGYDFHVGWGSTIFSIIFKRVAEMLNSSTLYHWGYLSLISWVEVQRQQQQQLLYVVLVHVTIATPPNQFFIAPSVALAKLRSDEKLRQPSMFFGFLVGAHKCPLNM